MLCTPARGDSHRALGRLLPAHIGEVHFRFTRGERGIDVDCRDGGYVD